MNKTRYREANPLAEEHLQKAKKLSQVPIRTLKVEIVGRPEADEIDKH